MRQIDTWPRSIYHGSTKWMSLVWTVLIYVDRNHDVRLEVRTESINNASRSAVYMLQKTTLEHERAMVDIYSCVSPSSKQ